MRALFIALVIFAGSGPGLSASAAQTTLEIVERAQVVEVIDGDTLRLDDGRAVRLVGIQAPKLPLGRAGFEAWPLAEAAKAALSELTLGRQVGLGYGGRRIDRHDRALAQVYLLDRAGEAGLWVQGALLEAGMARVYTFADNRSLIAEMMARERRAREARRGIWADRFYALRAPERLARHVGSFQLVEGRVLEAAKVKGRIYLNFGEDWKTDFTVTLAPAVRRLFESEGIDPLGYGGRRVRVRGWIKSFNGPMIEVSHPEQIEAIGSTH